MEGKLLMIPKDQFNVQYMHVIVLLLVLRWVIWGCYLL
jgi:hypothetical protein